MLAVFNYGREPANLSKNRFGNQADPESFQLRQQDGICRWLKTVSRKAHSPASTGNTAGSRSMSS